MNQTKSQHSFPFTHLLLAVYLAITLLAVDGFFAIDRFMGIGGNTQGNLGLSEYLRMGVFIGEYLIAVLVLCLTTLLSRKVGLTIFISLWIAMIVELATHQIFGRPMDINNIGTLNASIFNVSDALQKYFSVIGFAFLKSALIFVPLIYFLCKPSGVIKKRIVFALILSLGALYGVILIKRGAPALIGFPKAFSYAYGSIYLKANYLLFPDSTVSLVENRSPIKKIKNIIVVIDESVEDGYLRKILTPAPNSTLDYGESFSGANCSASSNYILRKGYWDRSKNNNKNIDIKKIESLFELAKNNGYSTAYIDNQQVLKDPTTRNYFDSKELSYVDLIIENNNPQYERDLFSLEKVQSLIGSGENFILINKNGAHFPYENTIPPSLISSNTIENYENSVRLNTAQFIQQLERITPADTIIFYTSDHGQNLTGGATHCNTGAEVNRLEYTVPFYVITKDAKIIQTLLFERKNKNYKFSHIEFSESIRNAMGLSIPDAVSIFQIPASSPSFCGLYGQPISFFRKLPECSPLSNTK